MNKKFTKHLSLLLLVVILLSSVPSFADTFTDVPSKPKHWAYEYIEEMVGLGIIKGYGDGTFKPNGTVNYLESLQLISGLITLTKEELSAATMAYDALLTELKIPWGHEAITKCLSKGIISETELRKAHSLGLTTTGTNKRPMRLDISIYLAKAMGLEELSNTKAGRDLPYKEKDQIESKYHKYLLVLIDAGVLHPDGKGEGYFVPEAPVQRSEIAKMMSTAYDYVQKNPVKPVEKEVVTIRGTVVSIVSEAQKPYVTIKDATNTQRAYFIDLKTTDISVNNRSGLVSDIKKDQEITLTIIKNETTALTVNVTNIEEDIEGTVKSISPSSSKMTIEYIKNKVTTSLELPVDKDATIYLNDKKADLYDIKVGDTVELLVRNKIIVDIEATSKTREVEGLIKEIITDTKGTTVKHFIKIINEKEETKEYEIDPKAYIYRKGRSAKIEDLKIGDKVLLDLEYEIVVELDADVVIKELEGNIIGINTRVGQGTILTIRNRKTNKDEEYTLARDVYIRVDNVASTVSDLKISYYVDIVVEGNEIVEIYSDSRSSNSTVLGKISYIDSKRYQLEISVDSFNQDGYKYGDLINVYAKSDVIVRDINQSNIQFKDLRKGDLVNVIGTSDGISFTADIIMLLKY